MCTTIHYKKKQFILLENNNKRTGKKMIKEKERTHFNFMIPMGLNLIP